MSLLLVVFVCLAGCKEAESGEGADDSEEMLLLSRNNLGEMPGMVYRSQVDSAIHWQPLSRETIELAGNSKRLILAAVVLPQQSFFQSSLRALQEDEKVVAEINSTYVPVLIDGDTMREWGILTAELCTETRMGPQFPFLIWLTPALRPIASLPISSAGRNPVTKIFKEAHAMVVRLCKEDAKYIERNSVFDQKARETRILERIEKVEVSADPTNDSVRALRQLVSLYDPATRTLDEVGGLFPVGALDLLGLGVKLRGVPEELREKSEGVLRCLLDDLLSSAMFDPLDGGVFTVRRGRSWMFPEFYRDCGSQARVVQSLMDCYAVTGDKRALEMGLGVLNFIEREYAVSGVYGVAGGISADPKKWLWKVEDLMELLTEKEMKLWIEASGVQAMGNLPVEADTARIFLRSNSLRGSKSAEVIATEQGLDLEEVSSILDGVRKKLLKVRAERLGSPSSSVEASAAASFRVVSAYASAYGVTGKAEFLQKAVVTLNQAKVQFSRGAELIAYESGVDPYVNGGRAFLYGLALQATLDVAAITLDEAWLLWADDLATTVAERFVEKKFIREVGRYRGSLDLPISDAVMIFDESSVGLLSKSCSRLLALGRPVLDDLGKHLERLPMVALKLPNSYSDVIQAALVRAYGTTYLCGPGISKNTRDQLVRLPLRGINRGVARENQNPADDVPAGQVLRIQQGKKSELVKDVSAPESP